MKFILFCSQPYAFSILRPLELELLKDGDTVLWYVPKTIEKSFSYINSKSTSSIGDLIKYKSDVIFVPGNDVPHFLRGVKVQIFHGLASEKKGHFRIRDFFDLYLTQGPHFTEGFKALTKERNDIKVIETGWSKLDLLYTLPLDLYNRKQQLLKKYNAQHMVLFAPTFSPKLTSANILFNCIHQIANEGNILVICKFHDLMDKDVVTQYSKGTNKNLFVSQEADALPLLQMADLMISDTSSIVYEFILLDKPVITHFTQSKNIVWEDVQSIKDVFKKTIEIINGNDHKKMDRASLKSTYHPFSDGKSSRRMITAVNNYITEFGIPEYRKVSLFRKFNMYKKYGFYKTT